ncbi:electron transfer flavoprotein subunit beta [Anaerotruncus rubiinfantis]|uniref:electron transfer flavoprotein subunit beta n=1 Tax=Anaerotruncus rubiinfantis TaxID=1720200 RepID=UPI0034A3EB4D
MEICVCLKQVPETQDVGLDKDTHTLQRDAATLILNPADAAALELAYRLKKVHGGSITALSMGGKKAAAVLSHAAAQGADATVLVSDPLFAGSDTFATAQVLSRAVRRLGPFDLILCGRRAIDGETGQVGGELSVMLDAAYLANVFSLGVEGNEAFCTSLHEEGFDEYAVRLPAVLSICEGAAQEHMPSLLDLRRARKVPLEGLFAGDLGFQKGEAGLAGSKTRVRRVFSPEKGMRQCAFAEDLPTGAFAICKKLAEVTG